MSTSAVSRSADSSIVAVSSRRSAADSRRFGSRRLAAATLIDVSGLRRSWPTADSSALRISVASARRRESSACAAARWLRNASSAWPAHDLEQAPVGRGERASGADQVQVLLDRHVDIGLLRRRAPGRSG